MVFMDLIPLNNQISMIERQFHTKKQKNGTETEKPLKIDEILKLLVKNDVFCVTESAKFSKKIFVQKSSESCPISHYIAPLCLLGACFEIPL